MPLCSLLSVESSGDWHCAFDFLVICAAAIVGLRLCVYCEFWLFVVCIDPENMIQLLLLAESGQCMCIVRLKGLYQSCLLELYVSGGCLHH